MNLGKFYGALVAQGEMPLHFLKIIDFNQVQDIPKPSLLFVHLLLDTVFAEVTHIQQLKDIFNNGLPSVGKKTRYHDDSDSDDFMGT